MQFHKSLEEAKARATSTTSTAKDGKKRKKVKGNGTLGDALRTHERVQGPEVRQSYKKSSERV